MDPAGVDSVTFCGVVCVVMQASCDVICRIGQDQKKMFVYGIFGRKITKYTVKYSVYIQFWHTLVI